MIAELQSPKIYSDACHAFSARFDVLSFDPEQTPKDLGTPLPPDLIRAVAARQAGFVAGRYAALQALKACGCDAPGRLERLPNRAPSWPRGFLGSITHTSDFASAVVAHSGQLTALGHDCENLLSDKTALEIQNRILGSEEIRKHPASGLQLGQYTGLIFSAKESLYKALMPIVQKGFYFQDAEAVSLSREPTGEKGRIRLRLLIDLAPGYERGFEVDARFELNERIHTVVEF
jgi:enterobactin synthetase component D